MPKFRKKIVELDAVQFTGGNGHEIASFSDDVAQFDGGELIIKTLEGDLRVSPTDWVVRGVKGEFYPVKSDIFDQLYEPVEG